MKICITGGSKGIGKAIIKELFIATQADKIGCTMPIEVTDFSRSTGYDLSKAIPVIDNDIDVLILCAGAWKGNMFLNYTVNTALIDMVNKKTHIILILSNAAYQNYGNDDYTTAKAGLLLLARRLQKEGRKVTCICPGTTNTGFWDNAEEDNRKKCIPIEPWEIAEMVSLAIRLPSVATEWTILPRKK